MHPRPESCSCPGVLPQHNRPPTQRPSALCIPSPASSQDEPTWGVLYAWALGRVMKHPISPSRAVRVRGDGTGLARRKRAGMRAGSQLAGGGLHACKFQDGSQFWLRSVRHKHISERISNQISRAEFLGVSGPRLMEQVVRFRFLFGSSVLYHSSSTQLCPNCMSSTLPVVLTDPSCKATHAPPP